jgi:hypothetical protein
MNKGSQAPAPVSKAVEGKMDHSKPAGGKVDYGYAPAGRKGKKA